MTHSDLNLVGLGRGKSENLMKKLTTSVTKQVGKRGAGGNWRKVRRRK